MLLKCNNLTLSLPYKHLFFCDGLPTPTGAMLRVRAGQVLLLRDTFVAGIAVGTADVPATLYKSIHVPRSADIPDPYRGLP